MQGVDQKGFALVHWLLGFIILLGVISGLYFLTQKTTLVRDSILKSIFFTNSRVDTKVLSERLNNFPIYPAAQFVKEEQTTGCVGDREGKRLCNLKAYVFKSGASYKEVGEWYLENHGAFGWTCDMGAFNHTREFSSNEKVCQNENLNLTYILVMESDSKGTALYVFAL
jgi:hypothetical protein